MSNDDWQNGYSAGYQNGFEAGYNKGKLGDSNPQVLKISDPGPVTPDGLSYEEIYGSVIYQQNKKKET